MALFNKRKREESMSSDATSGASADFSSTDSQSEIANTKYNIGNALSQLRRQERGIGAGTDGAAAGNPYNMKIGTEQIKAAYQTLQEYKRGKANLEAKIVDNEQWFKLRHWESMRAKDGGKKSPVEPTSAWLFNAIANKHADAMDNFPSPNILPREEGDKEEAKMLSSIIPVILDQADFEQTYDDVTSYKLKTGTGVYGIFWDSSKLNGLGDISVRMIDVLNLFWEPGIRDIQQSQNLFHVELVDNDVLKEMYPNILSDKLSGDDSTVAKYIYDDTVDTTKKSAVIDWYYKRNTNGRTVLHYCKFVNDVVLFATENEEGYENGWYTDGEYPFVFDVLFACEGTPCGFGYIDIGKDTQAYIDRMGSAILKNALFNCQPRHFVSTSGSVNEKEYLDTTNPLVHVDGQLGNDTIQPISANYLPEMYLKVQQTKIDELKETLGNRDISTGGTSSGVTAASAIAAMQEAGSKLSRDDNKSSYRAFRKICLKIIERIRQFYDLPRTFRILGENGAAEYVTYSNSGIVPQSQGTDFGIDMQYRVPLFDVEVTAQKQSPYSKMSQNELALQFFSVGFFNPQLADQALMCLDMMDFDRKEFIMQKVAESAARYQAQQLLLAQAAMMNSAPMPSDSEAPKGDALEGGNVGESSVTRNARERVASSTSPR